jgi:hypothetical protein
MKSALEQAFAIVSHAQAKASAETADKRTRMPSITANDSVSATDEMSLIGNRLYATGTLSMRANAVCQNDTLHLECDFEYNDGEVLHAHLYHSIAYQFVNARERTGRFSIRARLAIELQDNTKWVVQSMVLAD